MLLWCYMRYGLLLFFNTKNAYKIWKKPWYASWSISYYSNWDTYFMAHLKIKSLYFFLENTSRFNLKNNRWYHAKCPLTIEFVWDFLTTFVLLKLLHFELISVKIIKMGKKEVKKKLSCVNVVMIFSIIGC